MFNFMLEKMSTSFFVPELTFGGHASESTEGDRGDIHAQ